MTKLLLKNKLTTAILAMLFLAFVPMQSIAQKKIAYITKDKAMGTGASAVDNDAIIRMFQADPTHFTITVFKDNSSGSSAVDFSQYDLAIIQETFGSGDAVLKPTGLYAIKNITIPVIYNKAYALRGTKGLTTSAATAADVTDLAITVPVANQSNPLFTGITFTNDAITIFNGQAADDGTTTGTLKSLQYVTGLELGSSTGTCKGFVTGVTSADNTVVINDIPGGTSFGTGGDVLPATSRMIAFAWNYGAIAAGDGTNLTADALKLWKNAAMILTGQSLGLKQNELAADSFSVYPSITKGLISVSSSSKVNAITVFDVTGKQVQSVNNSNSVNLSNQAKGVYLVKVQTENGIGTKKVIVE
jgi:hypothetical protein